MTANKGKTPKCKWCGQWVDKSLNQFNKVSAGYYHSNCYHAFLQSKQDRQDLSDYVAQIYSIEFPTGWMLKQIKEYKEKRNYTYKGMELTLRYIYEIENKYLREASESGLGLIPYYYEKAKKYHMNIREVTKSASNAEINNEAEIIYLKPTKRKVNKKLIDMNSLIEGD